MEHIVISLHQPWAFLMATGEKKMETRSWPTKYRGPLAIHAAKRPVKARELKPFAGLLPDEFTYGAILAIVDVYGVRPTEEISPFPGRREYLFGNFEPGRFAWLTRGCKRLARPFPCLGRQGFFFVDIPESYLTGEVPRPERLEEYP